MREAVRILTRCVGCGALSFFTLLKFAIPMTSWGTTWPTEKMASWFPSQTSLLSWAGQGLETIPFVASETMEAGQWPMVVTSFLQSWTRRTSAELIAGENIVVHWGMGGGRGMRE